MKPAARTSMLAVGLALALGPACSDETIVLATAPAVDGGGKPYRELRCVATADCPDGDYCKKDRCESPAGVCEHRPLYCGDARLEPVCGCTSGVTYFNDCYRQQAGEESASRGECLAHQSELRCDDEDELCPLGTTCELLGGAPSGPACGKPKGRCWGIITCPPGGRGEWDECSSEPNALRCVDTCTAIQTGRRFTKNPACPR